MCSCTRELVDPLVDACNWAIFVGSSVKDTPPCSVSILFTGCVIGPLTATGIKVVVDVSIDALMRSFMSDNSVVADADTDL